MAVAATKDMVFSPDEDLSAVDKLVLGTINAPYKRSISASALQSCLANVDLNDWAVHVATFFTDVSPELVFGFAHIHGISKSNLARVYLAMKAKTGESNPDLEADLVLLAPTTR